LAATAAIVVVFLVGILHVYFKAFGLTPEFAAQTKTLAANQGLYNGFLAAGLFWGLYLGQARLPVCTERQRQAQRSSTSRLFLQQ
jgi:putative membrane protein